MQGKKGSHSSLHAHGDGTYHVMHGGEYESERTDHKNIGAALMQLHQMHGEGDGMHIQGDEDGYTTHHTNDGGKVRGPHQQKTIHELKRHIQDAMEGEDRD